MTADEIQSFTRSDPFVPIRVTLTSGEEFDIIHPDMLVAAGQMVCLLRPSRPGSPARLVHASLLNVQKIDYLTTSAAPPVDRSTV